MLVESIWPARGDSENGWGFVAGIQFGFEFEAGVQGAVFNRAGAVGVGMILEGGGALVGDGESGFEEGPQGDVFGFTAANLGKIEHPRLMERVSGAGGANADFESGKPGWPFAPGNGD